MRKTESVSNFRRWSKKKERKKKRSFITCQEGWRPYSKRVVLRQLNRSLLDHLRFIFKPPTLIYKPIPSLWISPTPCPHLYGCVDLLFSCLLWPREEADCRLPKTTAVPLGACTASFRLRHVHPLLPLLPFLGRISMCVFVCMWTHLKKKS